MKKSNTRRALLMSALSLLLCISMLIGTTYAWFTDSVTSANNIIKSGNLDIELEYTKTPDVEASWKTVEGASDLFDPNALWEPGYTQVVYLRVANKGSLALKYQMGMNIVSEVKGTNKDGKTFKLSDYIEFGVVEGEQNYGTDRAAARKAVKTAQKISGGYTTANTLYAKDNIPAGGVSEEYMALVVYMPEAVGNEANSKTGTEAAQITLGVNVVATQMTYEEDSFDELYDKEATFVDPWDGTAGEVPAAVDGVITITAPEQLAAFAASVNGTTAKNYSGLTVKLGADINLNNVAWTPIGSCNTPAYFQGTFDGQGHTIYGLNVDRSEDTYMYSTAGLFGWIDAAKATIKNVKIDGATVKGSHWVGALVGYMTGTVENCAVTNSAVTGYNVNNDANGDKVGGMIGYMNSGNGKLADNTVSNTVVKGYRDVAGLAGAVAVDNTVVYNTVTDTNVFYTADYAGKIVSPKTKVVVDDTNKDSNVQILKNADYTDTTVTTYYLGSAEDLVEFAAEVNRYSNYERPFEGKTILLTNDVDLGGMEWTPIGDYRFSANRFCGTFDGQGHTISNFKITKKTDKNDSNKSSYGFFGNMEGTVQNLTIDQATVSSYAYTGALIGRMNSGSVINCHVKNSTVECSYWQAGGMIGQLNDGCTVRDCSITKTTTTGASAIGGMFGPLTATDSGKVLLFENCSVNDCAVVQKGSFGSTYDAMFGAMFADIDVADNQTTISNCTAVNTTVKDVATTALYNTISGSAITEK